jgi:uncharacterized damage-inducible protein DinB
MDRHDILFLFGYHYWATQRILERLDCVGPERFVAASSAPHNSLRDTLLHALSAEMVWRQRMQEGVSPQSLPALDEVQSPDALRAAWSRHRGLMRAYLAGLTDADLQGTFRFRRTNGEELEFPLGAALAHVVNHGTQHRAEAAIILTEHGCSPGDLDMSLYLRALMRGEASPLLASPPA